MNRRMQNNPVQPTQPDKPHNPNPFDFVPFAEHPITRPEADFDALGKPISGYLELRIKALTPIHIVGSQKNQDGGSRYSTFYRQNGEPCIPAATIRGCLRAFMEALTSGWVSQATPQYKKDHGKRHRSFATFNEIPGETESPAIRSEFQPKAGAVLDVASYLFGLVVEKGDSSSAHSDLAQKSRVYIEDALFTKKQLDASSYWLPDIGGEAFMGGAKASASSWWYMKPKGVEKRVLHHGHEDPTEFIGEEFRGRKFYFHQRPEPCLQTYDPTHPETLKWNYNLKKPFRRVGLEAFNVGKTTETFRIYINRIPGHMLALLVLSLFPGEHIRHKLGYGKAYGYGSFEFILENAWLRTDDARTVPPALKSQTKFVKDFQSLAWDETQIRESGLDPFIDRRALKQLALILSWNEADAFVFTYPPFDKQNFQIAIPYMSYDALPLKLRQPPDLAEITKELYPLKRTIDFRLYQERSNCWDLIKKRKP